MVTNKAMQIEQRYGAFYYSIYSTFSHDSGGGVMDFYHETFDADFFTREFQFQVLQADSRTVPLLPERVVLTMNFLYTDFKSVTELTVDDKGRIYFSLPESTLKDFRDNSRPIPSVITMEIIPGSGQNNLSLMVNSSIP